MAETNTDARQLAIDIAGKHKHSIHLKLDPHYTLVLLLSLYSPCPLGPSVFPVIQARAPSVIPAYPFTLSTCTYSIS